VINARATGKGESIDVAMFEVMARMGLYYNINYLKAGITYPRPADRSQDLCGIGTFEAADGDIAIVLYGAKENH
ncbi:CoA transferase, partial [Acinetobacter baumannii]|nr:CoA transferase [Acinetobacter baumannii]